MRVERRWDVWECAECGRETSVHSVPHQPPVCHGTTMWFKEMFEGRAYVVDDDDDEQ